MKAQVVLPVYNEQRRLPRSLPRLHAFLTANCPLDWSILIANNGSTDQTQWTAERLCREYPRTAVVCAPENGRGGALKRAWLASDAEILSYMDVDLATGLEAFPQLIDTVACDRADLAIGSRFLPASRTTRGWRRRIISTGYRYLAWALCGTNLSDFQCGFKAISRKAAQALLPLVEDAGWFFDTELLLQAEKNRWRVAELAVTWTEDDDSRVRLISTAWQDLRGLCRLHRKLGTRRQQPLTLPKNVAPTQGLHVQRP
jgi:glycosyltransferase involved in cell wall biosynthesis